MIELLYDVAQLRRGFGSVDPFEAREVGDRAAALLAAIGQPIEESE